MRVAVELSGLIGYLIPLLIVILVLGIVIAILKNLKTIAAIGMGLLVISFIGANVVKDKSDLIGTIQISNFVTNGMIKNPGPINKENESIHIGFDAGDEFTAMDVEIELYSLNNAPKFLERKDSVIVGKKYLLFSFKNNAYETGNYKFVVKVDGKTAKEQTFKII